MQKLLRDSNGANMVEYALLAGFVAVTVAGVIFSPVNAFDNLSSSFFNVWANISNALQNAIAEANITNLR
jgi:Flp pilus assembly pilin Flp